MNTKDVLNTLALSMEELHEMVDGFAPTNMLIDRSMNSIKMDVSTMENVTLAILSDN